MILQYSPKKQTSAIQLPASKSISNRLLIAFSVLGYDIAKIHNLSTAQDTQVLINLLLNKPSKIDIGPAGTTFRFLTAFLAISDYKGNITGSERFCERPQKPLIDVLRQLGAQIKYLGKEGFAPIELKGFIDSGSSKIQIDCSQSSQFLSAILLICPLLKRPIKIEMQGKVVSESYIRLTQEIIAEVYNIKIQKEGNVLHIPTVSQSFEKKYTIPADWSSTTYFYLLQYLIPSIEIPEIPTMPYHQADSAILDFKKQLANSNGNKLVYDFLNCPDMASTCIVWAAVMGKDIYFTGLSTLADKESNRLLIVQENLLNFGVELEIENGEITKLQGRINYFADTVSINTAHDHRIAMAFAPLAFFGPIQIDNPNVVEKSFPDFWQEIAKIGFSFNAPTSK